MDATQAALVRADGLDVPFAARDEPAEGPKSSAPSTLRDKLLEATFSAPFLAFLTALVTGIFGPSVTREFTRISESEKLRVELTNRLMDVISKTEFTDPNQVLRAATVASLFNENAKRIGLTFQASVASLQTIAEELKNGQLAHLRHRIDESTKSLAETQREAEKQAKEVKIRERQVADLNVKLGTLKVSQQREIQDTRAELKIATEALKDTASAKATLDTAVSRLQSDYTQLKAQHDTELKNLLAQSSQISNLNAQLQEAKALVDNTSTEASALRNQLRASIAELQKVADANRQLTADNSALSHELEALKSSVSPQPTPKPQ